MRQEAATLQAFYASPLGEHITRLLSARLKALWPDLARTAVLGHGYVTPLLGDLPPGTKARIASMPASQGATTWSGGHGAVSTVLVEDESWPFMNGVFDRVIIMHGIEEAVKADRLIKEAWRVLVPEGRIVVLASNRLGLWSRSDRTPFGHGRPWTRLQLAKLLSANNFQVSAWSHALYAPPMKTGWMLKLADPFEKAGETITPNLAGIVMVEGIKRLYIEPHKAQAERLVPVPAPAHKTAAPAPNIKAHRSPHPASNRRSLTKDRS